MCKRIHIDSIFPFFDSRTQVLTYLYYNTYNTSLRVENSTLLRLSPRVVNHKKTKKPMASYYGSVALLSHTTLK